MSYSGAALAFLRARAIAPEVAEAAGVAELDGELRFPCPEPGAADFHRTRSLNGSGPAKVRQPKGRELRLSWPGGKPEHPEAGVLVCEGETDALAALSALRSTPEVSGFRGLPVAAMPGTGFPATRLAEELEALGSPPAYLALDADEAGRKATGRAAAALRSVAVRAVRVELPDGSDLAECLARADAPGDALANLLADAQAAAEGADYDPEVGSLERLNNEVRAQGGSAEFLRVRQVGEQKARWHPTVRSRRTGQPVELDSLTTKQLRSLPNLAERVMEARGGVLPTPRANSEKHRLLMEALEAAAEFEDHGATEAGSWRRRLAQHLENELLVAIDDEELQRRDPSTPSGKQFAIVESRPFQGPDGRLWVHAGRWLEYLENRRTDADDATVRAALRHLGFEPVQLTAKVGKKSRTRRYWRSPEGFDWETE